MGKVLEKITVTNLLDPTRLVEVEAVVDTGATMLVLPREVVERLGLEKIEEINEGISGYLGDFSTV
jgi:predicted aspartyl protease